MSKERLNWHQAFYGAFQWELADYRDYLEFRYEEQLTTEPLRIDILVVKKKQNAPIAKNIAAIFRRDNVIEYKSPDDYVSVKSFNKTLAYCYLYASIHDLAITDISLTIVESRYPQKVIRYIKDAWGWEVEETESGIHQVRGAGMALPIQFIESRKLREDENRWITGLRRDLNALSLGKLLEGSTLHQEDALMREYLRVVLAANAKALEEVRNMGGMTIDQFLEEAGYIEKWLARGLAQGEARGRAQGVKETLELLQSGKTPEEILQMYDVPEFQALNDQAAP